MSGLWVHTAKVTGAGAFPIDMLRYDRCYPDTEADAGLIGNRHDGYGPSEVRTVTVRSVSDNRFVRWTATRWASFGWKLIEEGSVKR